MNLSQMASQADAIAGGDLSQTVEANGDLAYAFRKMQVNLQQIAREAQVIAAGDLSRSLDVEGDLADALNQMIADLGHLVKQIKDAGVQLNSSTNEIVAASQEQSTGATAQAAAINQTVATVEELAETAGQIAESADIVAQLGERSLKSARAGQGAINEVIEAMDAILKASRQSAQRISFLNERSKAIDEVLEIITNIARKTDLLSLNAAIEAVNAGEAGKGFGVVASETRRLAEDVIESTKEIRNLTQEIQDSISASVMATEQSTRQVNQGSALVEKTEQSLNAILEMIQQTADAAKGISISTQQQRMDAEQMVAAMREIGGVSSQAEAGAKQTVAVANDLMQLGKDFEETIDRFKL